MKAADMRAKGADELAKQLKDLLQEQFTLKMSKATGQLGRTHRLQEVRREIARVRTVMGQKGN